MGLAIGPLFFTTHMPSFFTAFLFFPSTPRNGSVHSRAGTCTAPAAPPPGGATMAAVAHACVYSLGYGLVLQGLWMVDEEIAKQKDKHGIVTSVPAVPVVRRQLTFFVGGFFGNIRIYPALRVTYVVSWVSRGPVMETITGRAPHTFTPDRELGFVCFPPFLFLLTETVHSRERATGEQKT